jgi:hypothetical protein
MRIQPRERRENAYDASHQRAKDLGGIPDPCNEPNAMRYNLTIQFFYNQRQLCAAGPLTPLIILQLGRVLQHATSPESLKLVC